MDTVEENLVAGVFTSREQADAVLKDLLRIGLTADALEVGVPEPGRYQLEDHGSQEIGQGAVIGIAIGVPVGSLAGIGMVAAAVSGMASSLDVIGLGILFGGFWGIFFGGLAGMVPKIMAHADELRWYVLSEGGPEILVIARAGSRVDDVRKVMRRRGARAFFAEIPATLPVGDAVALAG